MSKSFFSIFKQKTFYITLLLTFFCSLGGRYLASLPILKVVGSMIISLLFGMLVQTIPNFRKNNLRAISFISNKFLRLGIILLGFKLNLNILISSGTKSLIFAFFVVLITTCSTFFIARKFKVDDELSLLTSSGCGICGAAAVMGISPQVDADADDSVLAVAIVAILGTIFTILIIFLKPVLNLTSIQFGILCGASLHEIAHVVAAASSNGIVSTMDAALIMKLSRVILLAPTAILIGIFYKNIQRNSRVKNNEKKIPIPWFMFGFLFTSALGTFLSLQIEQKAIKLILLNLEMFAFIILAMAMSALGMSVNFKVLFKRGVNILIAAILGSFILFLFSLFIVKIFF